MDVKEHNWEVFEEWNEWEAVPNWIWEWEREMLGTILRLGLVGYKSWQWLQSSPLAEKYFHGTGRDLYFRSRFRVRSIPACNWWQKVWLYIKNGAGSGRRRLRMKSPVNLGNSGQSKKAQDHKRQ